MPFKFTPNAAGIAALGQQTQMGRAMKAYAEQGAEAARSIAPVRTGSYQSSIQAEEGSIAGVVGARINAYDFKAHWIEFGAGPSPYRGGNPFPAHGTLRRGAELAGLHVVASR